MFRKYYYSLVLTVFVVLFTACQTLMMADNTPTTKTFDTVMVLPITEIPLPSTDFAFLFPESTELSTPSSPRKNITLDFSQKERTDIAVSDPKLMGEDNSIIVDLGLIKTGDYAFPLPGAKVISDYAGRRKHHTGIDLKTGARDTIVSAFDGVVRLAKPYYGYGNIVVVRHYNGLETLYSHNSKNLVKPGDLVKAGQPIALTGRTGRATTDHLHFEVRVNGQHFNPNLIFDTKKHDLNDQCLVFSQKGNKLAVNSIERMPHQLKGAYSYYPKSKKNSEGNENKEELL